MKYRAFFNYWLKHFHKICNLMVNLLEGNCRDTEICKEKHWKEKCYNAIVHFTVVCLVAKQTNNAVFQMWITLLSCQLHTHWHHHITARITFIHILVSITTWSPSASLQSIYTIVKWSNELNFTCRNVHQCLC